MASNRASRARRRRDLRDERRATDAVGQVLPLRGARMIRVVAALAILTALSACGPGRSINPLARTSEFQTHCRRALDTLVAGDAEKERISIEDIGERERTESRRPTQAVTIVYRQGD